MGPFQRLAYTHSFLFLMHCLGSVFHQNATVLLFTIQNPTFVPAHQIAYLLLPHLSAALGKRVPIVNVLFVEMSLYYCILQMTVLHILQTLCSPHLAWLTALYFAVYFLDHVAEFTQTYPACSISRGSTLVFIYCPLLISFQQSCPFPDAASLSSVYIHHHFEAMAIADAVAWVHSRWSKSRNKIVVFRQKQNNAGTMAVFG